MMLDTEAGSHRTASDIELMAEDALRLVNITISQEACESLCSQRLFWKSLPVHIRLDLVVIPQVPNKRKMLSQINAASRKVIRVIVTNSLERSGSPFGHVRFCCMALDLPDCDPIQSNVV